MDPPVNQAQRPCIPLHYIYKYTEREGRWTPQSIKHRGLAYPLHCIYIEREGRWTPQSIKHRGLAYCYTAYIYIYIYREREKGDGPPSQLSTEALHTATLHIYREREGRWTMPVN